MNSGLFSNISEKGAIVTGSAKRIGRAIAIFLASCDYDVVAHYNSSDDDAISLKEIIEKVYHKRCLLVKADLTLNSKLQDLIDKAFKFNINCKVLVNNASIFYSKTFLDSTVENYYDNFQLHLYAPLFLTQNFIKMCRSRARIINMIDANIITQKSKYFPYMLSKKSLADFTKLSAAELTNKATINGICPSLIPDDDLNNINHNNLTKNLKVKNILEKIRELLDNAHNHTGEFYFI